MPSDAVISLWPQTYFSRPREGTWWRHQMETFSAFLAICAGNSPVTGEFPSQRPVTRSFDVFFGMLLNKQLNKQWRGWWIETPSRPLWRNCNEIDHLHAGLLRKHCFNMYWCCLSFLVTEMAYIMGSRHYGRKGSTCLSLSPLDITSRISQTIFSDAFYWMKSFILIVPNGLIDNNGLAV